MYKPWCILGLFLSAVLPAGGCEEEAGGDCTKGVYTGHVTISDKSDPALYEGYTQVTGNLTISCPNCASIDELRCLAAVQGDLTVSSNGALAELDLSGLSYVGGSIYVYQNPSLTALDLGQLLVVGSWITIRDNDAITAVRANELLVTGGDVAVEGNAVLENLELQAATQIPGALTLSDNPELQFCEAPSLLAVGAGLTITGNSALADLDGLAGLSSLGGGFDVSHNVALPFCEVCELLDQLQGFAGELTCTANLADSCWSGSALDCPPPSGDGAIMDAEP